MNAIFPARQGRTESCVHGVVAICVGSEPDYGVGAVQVAETATQFFISGDRPNVSGLVLAGSADFKTELSTSDMFDQRLGAIVLAVVDVSYGALPSPRLRRECSSPDLTGCLTNFLPSPVAADQMAVTPECRQHLAPAVLHLTSSMSSLQTLAHL